jgi:8-oxo-dGTP pyrophosphatase MutT (NUDIX family)
MARGGGWVTCAARHRHWGAHGAARLLVRAEGRFLLQRRAWHVHHGGTWSVPGGARLAGESSLTAARREAAEEMGPLPEFRLREAITDDHGGWAYVTHIADAAEAFTPRGNWESDGHGWFTAAGAAALPLHPGFAALAATRVLLA